jgi:hypothetical protein
MNVLEDELQGLYTWVDEIPLSRPKRNIARDFSDGGEREAVILWLHVHVLRLPTLLCAVLMAEVVHHYFPKLVELHNYR